MELRNYIEVIHKRKWVILFVSLCVILGYSIFFFSQSPSYTAQSRILLRLPPEWRDMPVIQMPSWETRISLIQSQPVINRALKKARDQGMEVSYGEIEVGISVESERNTDFVDLYFTSDQPRRAIRLTNVITKAFLEFDRANNQESLTGAEESLKQETDRAMARLNRVEERLAHAREVQDISKQLKNQRRRLAQLEVKYGPLHPERQEAERTVSRLEKDLVDLQSRVLSPEEIKNRSIEELMINEADLNDLSRRVEIANSRVNELQSNLDQVIFNKSLVNRSAKVISEPESTTVSYPTTYQTYGFVILAGFILGISTGSFLEYINDRIVTKFDIHRYLGLPVLGTVPKVEPEEIDLLENPMKTPLGERYHSISVVLEYSLLKEKNRQSILVTSSIRGEGKSSTALNLGVSLAREGEQVLLIDLDLRSPQIHRTLGLMNSRGASTILSGDLELEHAIANGGDQSDDVVSWTFIDEIIEESPQPGLDVLPSGPLPSNPIQNMKSEELKDLLAQARKHYGIVILDSPPLNSVIDSLVLATRVDGVLMIVQSGEVRRGEAQHAKHLLEDADAQILGTVLNQVTQEMPSYYSYYDQPGARQPVR